jgi:hypothetical protein
MAEVTLRSGQVVLLDDDDLERLGPRGWSTDWHGYVRRSILGTKRKEFLHRLVAGCTPGDGVLVDHKNRNKLDNRSANLRVADPRGNAQNRSPLQGASSTYRGVTWNAACQKWQAQVGAEGRSHYLGLFVEERDAARVAAQFRAAHMPYAIEDPELLKGATT